MTAAWEMPGPDPFGESGEEAGADHPRLRLVGPGDAERPPRSGRPHPSDPGARRRVSPQVRRRRTLLAVMGLCLAALALPLGGTGGRSHATGSVPAGTAAPATYTVGPGDSLWSIAQRADPGADPRPTVARLTAERGTDRVVPGQRIRVP